MVPKWCPDVKNRVVKRKTATITRYKKSLCLQGFSQITYKKICGNTGRFWLFHDPRNAVSRKASRVRIPNSPPKSPVTKRFSGLFFFVRFRKTASKPPQEQPDFRKELRLFCLFRRIRTVKLGSFRRHINFHSIYCQNSPFRATPFRLPLHLPRTVLTSSQDERKC